MNYVIKVVNEHYRVDPETLTVYTTLDKEGAQRGSSVSGFTRMFVLQEYLSQNPSPELQKRIEEIEKNDPIPYEAIKRTDKLSKIQMIV
mgnify:CR=1 FL=1